MSSKELSEKARQYQMEKDKEIVLAESIFRISKGWVYFLKNLVWTRL